MRASTTGMNNVTAKATPWPAVSITVGLTLDSTGSPSPGPPAVVLTAAGPQVEDSVDMAAHHHRRELAAVLGTGVLPQQAPGQGEVRRLGIPVLARGEGQAVAGGGYRLHGSHVEAAIRIREVGRRLPELFLDERLGAGDLVAHAGRRLVGQQGMRPRVGADGNPAPAHLGQHGPG